MHDGKMGSAITVQVVTGGEGDEIVDILGDGTIQVRLAGILEGHALNTALVRFLAHILKVPKSKIDVVAGLSGRSKIVSILDLNSEETQARILSALD